MHGQRGACIAKGGMCCERGMHGEVDIHGEGGMCVAGDTVNTRAVRILLECILVITAVSLTNYNPG